MIGGSTKAKEGLTSVAINAHMNSAAPANRFRWIVDLFLKEAALGTGSGKLDDRVVPLLSGGRCVPQDKLNCKARALLIASYR